MPEFIGRPQLPSGLAQTVAQMLAHQADPYAAAIQQVGKGISGGIETAATAKRKRAAAAAEMKFKLGIEAQRTEREKAKSLADIVKTLGKEGMLVPGQMTQPAIPGPIPGVAGGPPQAFQPPQYSFPQGAMPMSQVLGAAGLPVPPAARGLGMKTPPPKLPAGHVLLDEGMSKKMLDLAGVNFSSHVGKPFPVSAIIKAGLSHLAGSKGSGDKDWKLQAKAVDKAFSEWQSEVETDPVGEIRVPSWDWMQKAHTYYRRMGGSKWNLPKRPRGTLGLGDLNWGNRVRKGFTPGTE